MQDKFQIITLVYYVTYSPSHEYWQNFINVKLGH
jgi:hypothetical protein